MKLMFNAIQSSTSQEEKTYIICVQAGQSNAESNSGEVVPTIIVPPPYDALQTNIIKTSFNIPNFDFQKQQYNVNSQGRWKSGEMPPVPYSQDRAGVEVKLWKDIADATGKNILLIHLAYGGEGFRSGPSGGNGAFNLNVGTGTTGIFWTHYAAAWTSLRAYIAANNLTTENGFIYWFQGESDVNNGSYFGSDLPTAFTRMRAEFGEDVHVYSGGINPVRGASAAQFEAKQSSYVDANYTFMSNATGRLWADGGNDQTGVHLQMLSHFALSDEIRDLYLASL